MSLIYLDWAATAQPDPCILEASRKAALQVFANPSSKHSPGREAARLLEDARNRCAAALEVSPADIIFTSGGTESNNMMILSLLFRQARGRVLISDIEHPSCAEPTILLKRFGWIVEGVPADEGGIIRPEAVESLLTPDTSMVIIMAVNNETGAIQPVADIVQRIRSYQGRGGRKIHVHCDAVQAFGKVPLGLSELDVDSASLSAHKIAGPRGVGILYCRTSPEFLFRGGGQESDRRHGTENLPAIHGMSLAMEQAAGRLGGRMDTAAGLKSRMIERLSGIPGLAILPAEVLKSPEQYSSFILAVSKPPLPGEVLVRVLNDGGFSVSTGSACSMNAKKVRGTLKLPGIGAAAARSMIRISTGYTTGFDDIDAFCSFMEHLKT